MEKSEFSHDLKCPNGTEAKTIVLFGKTGIGKSAMGNSIIGAGDEVFDSMPNSGGVTATCQLRRSVLDDGQFLNVIDTPGFDSSIEHESLVKEIAKCVNLAKNGIHAVLLVLSVTSPVSVDVLLAIRSLKKFFGVEIADRMVVVFSHGDALGEMSLENFWAKSCSEAFKRTLEICGNRFVAFDNMTADEGKKSGQLKELLCLVDRVVYDNGGVPYTNELFVDPPDIIDHGVKFNKAYEEQLKLFLDQLGETTLRMENTDEKIARELGESGMKALREKLLAVMEDYMDLKRTLIRDMVKLRKICQGDEEKLKKIEKMIQETQEKFKECVEWMEGIEKKINCTIS